MEHSTISATPSTIQQTHSAIQQTHSTIQQTSRTTKHKRCHRYLAYPLLFNEVIQFATREGYPPKDGGIGALADTLERYIEQLSAACSWS
jgi:hypothetical protein